MCVCLTADIPMFWKYRCTVVLPDFPPGGMHHCNADVTQFRQMAGGETFCDVSILSVPDFLQQRDRPRSTTTRRGGGRK